MTAPTLSCPSCVSRLVEIRLGGDLVLRSCSGCDSRWWFRGAEPAELGTVLDAVGDVERARRPASRARTL